MLVPDGTTRPSKKYLNLFEQLFKTTRLQEFLNKVQKFKYAYIQTILRGNLKN